jgi:hypothetical protein
MWFLRCVTTEQSHSAVTACLLCQAKFTLPYLTTSYRSLVTDCLLSMSALSRLALYRIILKAELNAVEWGTSSVLARQSMSSALQRVTLL